MASKGQFSSWEKRAKNGFSKVFKASGRAGDPCLFRERRARPARAQARSARRTAWLLQSYHNRFRMDVLTFDLPLLGSYQCKLPVELQSQRRPYSSLVLVDAAPTLSIPIESLVCSNNRFEAVFLLSGTCSSSMQSATMCKSLVYFSLSDFCDPTAHVVRISYRTRSSRNLDESLCRYNAGHACICLICCAALLFCVSF